VKNCSLLVLHTIMWRRLALEGMKVASSPDKRKETGIWDVWPRMAGSARDVSMVTVRGVVYGMVLLN
jgi:hypothetical protein